MPSVVTINRPDVISLIEQAAAKHTGGNKTEAVALALRKLLEPEKRTGSPFGAMAGTVWIDETYDLTAPILNEEDCDAFTGRELDH